MEHFSKRLRIALTNKNMKQTILAYRLGVDRSYISNYLSGKYEAKTETISKIANILGVSDAWLAGYDVPMYGNIDSLDYEAFGLRPITKKRFPMLGEISCGTPIMANEDHESYIDAYMDIDADFCLTARGDSMIEARIKNGDVVFIKKQPIVNNGEIAAVIIDGEATLKKWFYYPEKQKLVLNPANVNYEPLIYIGAELDTVTCLGKAVFFMSNL